MGKPVGERTLASPSLGTSRDGGRRGKRKTAFAIVNLTEKDFLTVAYTFTGVGAPGRQDLQYLQSRSETDRVELVTRLLPSAVAKRLMSAVPEGFELSQITITGEISGKPFGIGVGGQVSAVFTKRAGRRR